ncbi:MULTISPECIES: hypothetical protein [Xanthomonas]|uniref:hypothetical protein n=1 Tax=Xanthomonas TaxID=338 RepID=UPI001C46F2DA|nr:MULTISPECIES: hypothetical protein [Xanthomonas]MBV6686359.1 hypothetical protein [Xanthomonas euvesicatoria pv. physalidis]UDB89779.1 hypothetical protein LCZ91_07665 [Xanthomonas citri pv. mangiferaeindicae]
MSTNNELGSTRRYLRKMAQVGIYVRTDGTSTNLREGDYRLLLSIADRIDEIDASESPDFNALEVILRAAISAIDCIRMRAELAAA